MLGLRIGRTYARARPLVCEDLKRLIIQNAPGFMTGLRAHFSGYSVSTIDASLMSPRAIGLISLIS